MFTVVLLFVLMQHASEPTGVQKTISVCDVVGDLKAYSGRVVAVRGEFESGPEQFFLSGGPCKKYFITDGYSWPDAVQLRSPGNPESPTSLPFEQDTLAVARFKVGLKQATAKNGAARGCITVVGMVQTRDDYHIIVLPDGSKWGHGFGHMSAFPAQLIIKTVKDWSLQSYSPDIRCACCDSTQQR